MSFDDLLKQLEKGQADYMEQLTEHNAKFEALERTYPYRVEVTKHSATIPVFFETQEELKHFSAKLPEMLKDKLLVFSKVKMAGHIVKGLPFIDIYLPINTEVFQVEVHGLYN